MQKSLQKTTGIVVNREVAVVNLVYPMHWHRFTIALKGFQLYKSWKPCLNLCYANRNHAAFTLAIC